MKIESLCSRVESLTFLISLFLKFKPSYNYSVMLACNDDGIATDFTQVNNDCTVML